MNLGGWKELLKKPIDINSHEKIYLRVAARNVTMQFYYSIDANNWPMAGEGMSTSDQSDDVSNGFTGILISICGLDVTYLTNNADFDYLELNA